MKRAKGRGGSSSDQLQAAGIEVIGDWSDWDENKSAEVTQNVLTANPDIDGPSVLVDGLEKQAGLPGLHHKLILPRQQLLSGRLPSGGIQEGFRRLEEKRYCVGVITHFAMGEFDPD